MLYLLLKPVIDIQNETSSKNDKLKKVVFLCTTHMETGLSFPPLLLSGLVLKSRCILISTFLKCFFFNLKYYWEVVCILFIYQSNFLITINLYTNIISVISLRRLNKTVLFILNIYFCSNVSTKVHVNWWKP